MINVYKITETMFGCWSDMAGYDYIVSLEKADDLEEAMEIARKELEAYGCPEEMGELEDYYFNSGYIEVVKTMLDNNDIEAEYYDNIEEE